MDQYTIQIRCKDTGAVIAARALSTDAGALLRRQTAEDLAKAKADPRDVYAVELRRDHTSAPDSPGSVIDKYELSV